VRNVRMSPVGVQIEIGATAEALNSIVLSGT